MLLLSVDLGVTSVTSARAVVLVAEDEVVVRNVICVLLQREGHEVLAAAHGQEALDLSRRYNGRIDLLVSDVQMPHMDGFSLVDQIRQERPGVRVLLMTGKMPEDPPEDKKDIPLLRKPFKSNDFIAKVRETLSNQA